MRKILLVLIGVVMALGAVFVNTEAAAGAPEAPDTEITEMVGASVEAGARLVHQIDSYTYWYCSKHRSHSWQTVIHSDYQQLYPGGLLFWCIQSFFGAEFQFFVRNEPALSQNSWLASGYQDCSLIVCQAH